MSAYLSTSTIQEKGTLPVALKAGGIVYAKRDEAGETHVTELVATEKASVCMLDSITRQAFPLLPCVAGTVHILNSNAGSGKTTSNIKLAVNLCTNDPSTRVLLTTFTNSMQKDGELKTDALGLAPDIRSRIQWSTIDSLVYQLYSSTIRKEDMVDLSNRAQVKEMAEKVLDRSVTTAEFKKWYKNLQTACETGESKDLKGVPLILYNSAMAGVWWSYSTLRVRALTNPAWVAAMESFGTVIVDEAQDINPVMLQLLRLLHSTHMMVYTRDLSQKIYTFMNCINVTKGLTEPFTEWQLYLTFRYGNQVCELVNRLKYGQCTTYPAEGVFDTEVAYMGETEMVEETHTYIFRLWIEILKHAELLIARGRAVTFDLEKREELLNAATGVTDLHNYDYLFSQMSKARVIRVCNAICADEESIVMADNLVTLCTLHSMKGLEKDIVRVSKSVFDYEGEDSECIKYVAITRARIRLVVPLFMRDDSANKRIRLE